MRTQGIRLAVLQRVCPAYRIALFDALSRVEGVELRLFIGADVPGTMVRSAPDLEGVPVTRLKTRFMRLGRRVLPLHVGLVDRLRLFAPDVILCEGESHFLGYLQAIYYRLRYARGTALLHWCLTALPGERLRKYRAGQIVKAFFRRHFDAFVVYSSYSRERLIELGEPSAKVFVATNVGDVNRHLALADSSFESKSAARRRLGLPAERFTVLYVGTLDQSKRPGVMLDLARALPGSEYSFVLAGSGDELETLRACALSEEIANVYLPGRVTSELRWYYLAADVLLIPGRGGIVISEAMAFGLPVVVHQADGTEYDLVRHSVTGLHLPDGSSERFRNALQSLHDDPHRCTEMGAEGRRQLERSWTTDNMVRRDHGSCKVRPNYSAACAPTLSRRPSQHGPSSVGRRPGMLRLRRLRRGRAAESFASHQITKARK